MNIILSQQTKKLAPHWKSFQTYRTARKHLVPVYCSTNKRAPGYYLFLRTKGLSRLVCSWVPSILNLLNKIPRINVLECQLLRDIENRDRRTGYTVQFGSVKSRSIRVRFQKCAYDSVQCDGRGTVDCVYWCIALTCVVLINSFNRATGISFGPISRLVTRRFISDLENISNKIYTESKFDHQVHYIIIEQIQRFQRTYQTRSSSVDGGNQTAPGHLYSKCLKYISQPCIAMDR